MTRNPRRTCKFSFYPGKNFSLSLSLPYSRALPLTRSPHGFVHFSEFFPSSILSDLFAIDRGEEELYFVFFFFWFLVLERNSTLRVRVLFLIILARLVSSFLFFLINNIFYKYFFSFFLRFRFALLYLL